jgi:tripartite-type tricarboxylate transporter receptor subunit TctC
MSGQVHMCFAGISGVLALVKDGKLKAVAVTSASEIVKALISTDVRKRLLKRGADPVPSTPEELGAFRKSALARGRKSSRPQVSSRSNAATVQD